MRTGVAWCLGLEQFERAAAFDEPLTLHATPLAWLAAGGDGTCILDPSALWARRLPERVILPNAEFGRQFERWVAPPAPDLPEMFIRDRAA